MAKCKLHSGRDAVVTVDAKGYCAKCEAGIKGAVALVNRHVEPKDCFVWHVGHDNWQPISGTGCAHWIAHQRNIRSTLPSEASLAGRLYRVRTLINGLPTIYLRHDSSGQGGVFENEFGTYFHGNGTFRRLR